MTQKIFADGGSLGLLFVDLGIRLEYVRIGKNAFSESSGYNRTNLIKAFDCWVFESATLAVSPDITYGTTKDAKTPPIIPIGFDIYYFQRLSRSVDKIILYIGSFPINGWQSYETVKRDGLKLTTYSSVKEFRRLRTISGKWHRRFRYIRERLAWTIHNVLMYDRYLVAR